MTLYLVRHGQSLANLQGIVCGQLDSALSALGIEQAQKLRHYFRNQKINFQYCYSSPLQRALSTAKILVDQHIEVSGALMEFNTGSDSQKTTKQLHQGNPAFACHGKTPNLHYTDGESLIDLHTRVQIWYRQHLQEISCTENILIVSHWSTLNLVAQEALMLPVQYFPIINFQNAVPYILNFDLFQGKYLLN